MIRISGEVNWPSVVLTLSLYIPMVGGWVFGIAVAKGIWMTVGAIFLPPMAWVLFAQWLLERSCG